jgi:hypothetical protein
MASSAALTWPGYIQKMPAKDKRVESRAWRFRTAIPAGISENLANLVLGLFRGRREQHELISLSGLQ